MFCKKITPTHSHVLYVNTYVYIHVYLYITQTCIYIHIQAYMYMYIHIYIYTCTCTHDICECIYTYVHIYRYMYTHTHLFFLWPGEEDWLISWWLSSASFQLSQVCKMIPSDDCILVFIVCVTPSPWVWAGLSDLYLTNRMQQKWCCQFWE